MNTHSFVRPLFFAAAVLAAAALSTDRLAAQGRRARGAAAARHGWHTDYQQARQLARQTNKPLMVVFRCEP